MVDVAVSASQIRANVVGEWGRSDVRPLLEFYENQLRQTRLVLARDDEVDALLSTVESIFDRNSRIRRKARGMNDVVHGVTERISPAEELGRVSRNVDSQFGLHLVTYQVLDDRRILEELVFGRDVRQHVTRLTAPVHFDCSTWVNTQSRRLEL